MVLRNEQITLRNGRVSNLVQSEIAGIGIRVLKNGAWGFACTSSLNAEDIKKTAKRAVDVAAASALCKSEDVRLAPEPVYEDFWATPFAIDPFSVPIEEKIGFMQKVDEILRKKPQIKVATFNMQFQREHQVHATTEGSMIEQILTRSGAGYSALAADKGESQIRSFPQSWGGNHKCVGYEILGHYDFLGNAERIRDEAIALLTAPECPSGRTTLILDGPQMALQIHESVGHANELDRVLGFEANFAGRSFMLPELHKKTFRYGSDLVNLVGDSTLPGGLATFGYDDDGVKAQRFHVVQNGIHKNWFTTRETAPFVKKECSNACNRAFGFWNLPITRIPNLSLMPGTSTLDEMIGGTDDGIMMEVNRSWSIDQMRLNFQFGAEIGRIIKKGKITGICKNPTYQGITPEFWGSCDAIGDQNHFDIWGVINCGKGQPMQVAEMSHGASPTRFRNIVCGVRA
ncbi:MAG: TldD/PmbA family protein [Planctomycetaceae bacterium]|nr:TldD/PmbA family protein [Planctomycetaceae bacterium]